MAVSQRLLSLLHDISAEILDAQRPLRVIRLLTWPEEVERSFFETARVSCHVRPTRCLPRSKPRQALSGFGRAGDRRERDRALPARDLCGHGTAARMLGAVGSKDFYFHSVEIYGRPGSLSSDRRTTNSESAHHFETVIAGYAPPPAEVDQTDHRRGRGRGPAARAFPGRFPGHEVRVVIVDKLASNASGQRRRDQDQAGARFRRAILRQIEYHELGVH